MGLLEFNKLPINTLVGADWKTFKDITGGRDIGAAYKGKYRLTMIRYSFWDTGVAELRLCIMFSPATSISATTRHTRLYFRIL